MLLWARAIGCACHERVPRHLGSDGEGASYEAKLVMTGIYNGDPRMRANKYHGVNLSINGPLFVISEAGYQINGLRGDSQRLGNYKVGGWYNRSQFTDFESGGRKRGSHDFYGLFDQVLVPFGTPGSSGFGEFGSITVAPDSHIQQLPLF